MNQFDWAYYLSMQPNINFSCALDIALMNLTNTPYDDYKQLSTEEKVIISKDITEHQLSRCAGVGAKSITKLMFLRKLIIT